MGPLRATPYPSDGGMMSRRIPPTRMPGKSLIPARDHLADAEREGEGIASQRRIELCAFLARRRLIEEPAGVVHAERSAGLGVRARSRQQIGLTVGCVVGRGGRRVTAPNHPHSPDNKDDEDDEPGNRPTRTGEHHGCFSGNWRHIANYATKSVASCQFQPVSQLPASSRHVSSSTYELSARRWKTGNWRLGTS